LIFCPHQDFGMSRLLEGTNEAKVHFLVNETYF